MFFIAAAVTCAGVLVGQLAAFQFQPNQIGLFAGDEPRLASLELQFNETPRLVQDSGPHHLPGKQYGNAAIVAIKSRLERLQEKASGDVLFSVSPQPEPRIIAGQRVRVSRNSSSVHSRR